MHPANVVGVGRLWPPRALTDGEAPDERFTLANERTFLAWIRTSLGLVAAAVGLEAFAPHVVPGPVRTPIVVVLLLVAAALAGYAFRRWLAVEGALRTRRELRDEFQARAGVLHASSQRALTRVASACASARCRRLPTSPSGSGPARSWA